MSDPIRKPARLLCGEDVGRKIYASMWICGPYDRETKTYPEQRYELQLATILMITHKKNGGVNVRTDLKECRFEAAAEVSVFDE